MTLSAFCSCVSLHGLKMATVIPAAPSALKTEKGGKAEGGGRAFFTSEEQKAFSDAQAFISEANGESLSSRSPPGRQRK